MLLNILLSILVVVCVALTAVILLQRSEGGALGMGGGTQGMFTARGAGDLLTRTTSILATIFFVLALAITLLTGHNRSNSSVTERLKVNPIDLNAIAASSSAPAASSAPGAPPLPNAAPPLPSAAVPGAAMPTQAPRPTARRLPPVTNQAAQPLSNITVGPAPSRSSVPRPDINAPTSGAPASNQ